MVLSNDCFGQKKTNLTIIESDHNNSETVVSNASIDSTLLRQYIKDHILKLHSVGYIHAHLDTLISFKNQYIAEIYRGKIYHFGKLHIDESHNSILETIGLPKATWNEKIIDTAVLYRYLKVLVQHEVNHGYPFAMARYDSLRFIDDRLHAKLTIERGRKIYFDSIVMEGRLGIHPSFMRRLLGIYEGELYAQDKVNRSYKTLASLPYVQQRSAPFVRFINDKASLIIFPDPKPASRFDFLIGVLPQVVNGVRKWNITGDFVAELNNILDQGEYTFFQFKRLKAENLELLVKSNVPYIAGFPLGSHIDFRMYKNGNQNLDLHFDGGSQYLFNGFNHMKLYFSYRSSTLLDIDLDQIKKSGRLPQSLDVSYSGVGMGLTLRDLNYRFNPSSGFDLSVNAVTGTKKILKNRQIENFDGFENSYDSLNLKTIQFELDFRGEIYFPIQKWATVKSGLAGAWKYNQNTLRTNELLKIGGSKTLRGFDEESLFTDKYFFATTEFRILLDLNSYLTIPFVDVGFVNTIIDGTSKLNFVLGTGLGLNFAVPVGIFNLSFAAGKSINNPLDFSKMKIHFGYVNLF